MGRRDNPHIHRDRTIAANARDNALFQNAEQFYLHVKAHVADLIQEEGSAICLFETADTAHCCSRERPLLMPEKLGLDQVDRIALDRDKWLVCPITHCMNGSCDHFLARSRRAIEQN